MTTGGIMDTEKNDLVHSPRRDLDVYDADDVVILQGDQGTITGTSRQIRGLAEEHARRQRGDRQQFESGEQLDI